MRTQAEIEAKLASNKAKQQERATRIWDELKDNLEILSNMIAGNDLEPNGDKLAALKDVIPLIDPIRLLQQDAEGCTGYMRERPVIDDYRSFPHEQFSSNYER